ncbi:hypothetical protein BDF22DRAFT_193131 [Syncephalis plumigaleata]|nr:hypothetical protein BDF22DRAFT_193131 [Syncephalis plumigaleata]
MDIDNDNDNGTFFALLTTADNITASDMWTWTTKRNADLYQGQMPDLTTSNMAIEDACTFNEGLANSLSDYLKQLDLTPLQEQHDSTEAEDTGYTIESKDSTLIPTPDNAFMSLVFPTSPSNTSQSVAICSSSTSAPHSLQTDALRVNTTTPSQIKKLIDKSIDAMNLGDTPSNSCKRTKNASSKQSDISSCSATPSIPLPVQVNKQTNGINDHTNQLSSTVASKSTSCKDSKHTSSSASNGKLLLNHTKCDSTITTPSVIAEQQPAVATITTTTPCKTSRKHQRIPHTSLLSSVESLFVNLLPMPKDIRYYERPFNISTASTNSALFKRRRLNDS